MAYNKMEKLRAYWCQKVIPLVYDESLSYYEFLCKLMKKINDVIEMINEMMEVLDDHEARLDVLEAWKTVMETWKTTVNNQITQIIDGTTPITLPIATATRLGVVKIGQGINVQADGTISVEGGGSPYVLPTMSASTKGGARLGSGLVLSDTDKLNVDGANLDISENTSITNLENDIDNIIDGSTEIDISENSTIETIEQNITNITDGTTPVPSSYSLPTMSASTKGGAKLGSGLLITNDTLSIDSDNLDLSNNTTITDIIDGTTEIDISENTTIENIIDGTTPVPSSYSLPTMSASIKGGAKVGSGLSVDANDILSVNSSIVKNSSVVTDMFGDEDNVSLLSPTYSFTPESPHPEYAYHYACCYMINDVPYISTLDVSFNSVLYTPENFRPYIAIYLEGSRKRMCWCFIDNFGVGDATGIGAFVLTTYDANGTFQGNYSGGLVSATSGYLSYMEDLYTSAAGVLTDKLNVQPIVNPIASSLGFNGICYYYNQHGNICQNFHTSVRGTSMPISNYGFSYTFPNDVKFTGWNGVRYDVEQNKVNIEALQNRVAVNVPQSTEASYPTVTEFNALLTALKNSGLMVADS